MSIISKLVGAAKAAGHAISTAKAYAFPEMEGCYKLSVKGALITLYGHHADTCRVVASGKGLKTYTALVKITDLDRELPRILKGALRALHGETHWGEDLTYSVWRKNQALYNTCDRDTNSLEHHVQAILHRIKQDANLIEIVL